MMRELSLAVLGGFALAACEPPPLSLRFALTSGDSQACYSDLPDSVKTTSCADVTLICKAVLSVRIVPPNEPTLPYVSVCKPLNGAQDKLCAIAGIDLPQPTVPVPEQVLEIQMAVFPADQVPIDPLTGELPCPKVEFGATGLPMTSLPNCTDEDPGTCPKVPAVGGRAFYHPGDETTVVTLGCTDLDDQLRSASCSGANSIPTTATVTDFDSGVSVDQNIANRLTVSIGEPTPIGPDYELLTQDTRELMRTSVQFPPSWARDVDLMFGSAKCLVVLEDGAQTTSSLTCAPKEPGDDPSDDDPRIDMTGSRMSKATLSQLLGAIGRTTFPDAGLTIGIVLDDMNNPAAGASITATNGATIQYVSADRSTIPIGSLSTSASGIFISQDATFGTRFSIPMGASEGYGGRVEGKVTLVVIRQQLTPQ